MQAFSKANIKEIEIEKKYNIILLCLFSKKLCYICNMKRKLKLKLLIILLIINSFLTLFNLYTNIEQNHSIKFNEKLYDVFLDNYYEK